jgi:hypothetical protein
MMKTATSIFKDKETFEKFLDTPEGEDFINRHVEDLYEISLEGLFEIPYWMEEWKGQNVVGIWVNSYWTLPNPFEYEGKKYKVVGSQPLSEEIEFQLDNGELYYHYVGFSYIAVLDEVTE